MAGHGEVSLAGVDLLSLGVGPRVLSWAFRRGCLARRSARGRWHVYGQVRIAALEVGSCLWAHDTCLVATIAQYRVQLLGVPQYVVQCRQCSQRTPARGAREARMAAWPSRRATGAAILNGILAPKWMPMRRFRLRHRLTLVAFEIL